MKKNIVNIAFGLLAVVALVSCKDNASAKINTENVEATQQEIAKAGESPVMTFDRVEHDFGTINEGDVAKTTFTFTNTGKTPLIIARAQGSCGCTVPSFPKEAVAPGATGVIEVAFNSTGKPNLQQKLVTLFTNTEKGSEILKIKAMVTPDPNKAASYNSPIN
jgi:hypothetical protein